jgi:hypothetical protein
VREVVVRPGDNIEALVAAHPPGTAFRITTGVYRLQSIRPKDGDSFIGEPGAVLSGAVVLHSFAHQGQDWVAKVNVTRQQSYRGKCGPKHLGCMFPEDLFFDSVPLQRVTALSAVRAGKWYLDYATGKAYVGSDPNGHKVEMSSARAAFWGDSNNVTIKGLTIKMYASIAGKGAITPMVVLSGYGPAGKDWAVKSNNIYLNHGLGVHVTNGMIVSHNKIYDNGQMGIGGGGNNILIENNDIYGNNYAGYAYDWEAGGAKIGYFSTHVTFRDNYVHDNKGPGLHGDIGDNYFVFEGNHTAHNLVAGIHYEISYHAVIRNNVVVDDGYSPKGTSLWYGAGILVTNSADVQVYGNTVVDCMNGIAGMQAKRGNNPKTGASYELRNLDVHNNVITQKSGIAAGIVAAPEFGKRVFESWNNRFADNIYHLAAGHIRYFAWLGADLNLRQWKTDRRKP